MAYAKKTTINSNKLKSILNSRHFRMQYFPYKIMMICFDTEFINVLTYNQTLVTLH